MTVMGRVCCVPASMQIFFQFKKQMSSGDRAEDTCRRQKSQKQMHTLAGYGCKRLSFQSTCYLSPIFPLFASIFWCLHLSSCPPSSSCFSSALSFLRPLLYGHLWFSYSREEHMMLSLEQPRSPLLGAITSQLLINKGRYFCWCL